MMSSSRPRIWVAIWVGCQGPQRLKSPSQTSTTTLQSSHRVSKHLYCVYLSIYNVHSMTVIWLWCDISISGVKASDLLLNDISAILQCAWTSLQRPILFSIMCLVDVCPYISYASFSMQEHNPEIMQLTCNLQ